MDIARANDFKGNWKKSGEKLRSTTFRSHGVLCNMYLIHSCGHSTTSARVRTCKVWELDSQASQNLTNDKTKSTRNETEHEKFGRPQDQFIKCEEWNLISKHGQHKITFYVMDRHSPILRIWPRSETVTLLYGWWRAYIIWKCNQPEENVLRFSECTEICVILEEAEDSALPLDG